ncbi:HEAT repeat domain-containing protein [Streptomyces sp. NPDC001812]|uniref:HEAT repeat domain-containing protein n=1 Tax=Streptomyces sp. NPDC001812 TaxID=3364611 RepID=UPI003692399E
MVRRVRQAYLERPALPVLEVLTKPEASRVVLLGDPGAGKSTLARYVALSLTENSPVQGLEAFAGWVPLLVELRIYAEAGWRERTFEDFLHHLHVTEGLGLPASVLEKCLSGNGQVVVVFDGLDELFDPQVREAVTSRIAGFASRHPQARILVTSRVIGYQRAILDGAGFAHFMLQDLDNEQIRQFVNRWYESSCPDDPVRVRQLCRRVTDAVEHSASVRELAGNPLILTILTIIGRRKELPRDRRTVYEHAVSVLVEQWDPNKRLKDRVEESMPYLGSEDRQELLQLVSRRMQEGQGGIAGNHIPGPDLLETFTGYLRERYELPPDRATAAARVMLQQLRDRNFVLSRYGGEVYGFVHRTFLEYLAATDIAHRFNEERSLSPDDIINGVFARRWKDPTWREVLLLLTGRINERFTATAIDHLLSIHTTKRDRFEAVRALFLAIRYISEVRKPGTLSRQSQAAADRMIDILESDDEFHHWFMLEEIDEIQPVLSGLGQHWAGHGRYLHWYNVRGQFNHPRPEFGESALELSAQIATALRLAPPADSFKLRHLATNSPNAYVRRSTLNALADGWADDPDTAAFLRDRATNDPEPNPRKTALYALPRSWAGDPDTAAFLRDRATNDPEPGPRSAALQVLARSWAGDPDTAAFLRDRATNDPEPGPRSAALQVLARSWADDPDTAAFLRDRATNDPEPNPRSAALQVLAQDWAGDPDTAVLLRDRATNDPEPNPRSAALQVLARSWAGDPDTAVLLRDRATNDPEPNPRSAALQVLARSWAGDPDTAVLLRDRATNDPEPGPRNTALQALAQDWAGDPDTAVLLRDRATNDPEPGLRSAALYTLPRSWADDPDTAAFLRDRATNDPEPGPRSAALYTLPRSWADDPDTAAFLRDRATNDPEPGPRNTALQALAQGWAGDPDTAAFLRDRATNDPEPGPRSAALQALAQGWAGDPDTAVLLRDRATNDPDATLRQSAVQTLARGWAGDPDTAAFLRDRAINDPDATLRQSAVQTLARGWAGDPDTAAFLRDRAINDPDATLRQSAVQWFSVVTPDPTAAVPFLARLADQEDASVRIAVVRALGYGWPTHPAVEPLLRERFARDPDREVRTTATELLNSLPLGLA